MAKLVSVSIGAAEALRVDLLRLVEKHSGNDAQEMLAVAAVLTGQLLAYQDQQRMTVQDGLAMINANIAIGNRSVVEGFHPINVRPV